MPVLAVFVLIPLIEIAGFVLIGPYLGVGGTLAFVVLSAVLGTSLLRSEGLATLRRLQSNIAAGATPVPAALDGACRIVAALLLVVPGFFSSAAGLLLLLPPVRRLVVRHLRAKVGPQGSVVWQFRRGGSSRVIIESADYHEIVDRPPALPPEPRDRRL